MYKWRSILYCHYNTSDNFSLFCKGWVTSCRDGSPSRPYPTLITRSSKDVQNCAYSPCLLFISGLLVQRRKQISKRNEHFKMSGKETGHVLYFLWLHHRWRQRQLYHHGSQPPGGDTGFHAGLHSEEGAVDIIVNKPWKVQVTKDCWGKWSRALRLCN